MHNRGTSDGNKVDRPPTGYVASRELPRRFFLSARTDVAAFIADQIAKNVHVRQAVFAGSRRAH